MKKKIPLYRQKGLRRVTTCDYIDGMKTKETSVVTDGEETTSSVVQEIAPLPGGGAGISVRAAKAHLSGLLDQVAAGREVVITSGGVPKARLVPINADVEWKPFTGTHEHLKTMPPWRGGKTGEELIRADRDERG
jgi:prevent-host-death family protein